MILSDFFRAVAQMGDARFRRVLLLGVGLSLILLIAVYAGFVYLIHTFAGDTALALKWIGPIIGLDTLLTWASALLMIGLSVFLMVPVASLFTGFFLEDVAQAVEDRHYPHLPAATPVPLGDALIDAVNFFALLFAVNIIALFAFFLAGPLVPLIFFTMNGYLLGREYFTLVAMRRLGREAAVALRKKHMLTIWIGGVLMALPLSVPLVNLLVPVLGAATFTHMFHRLAAKG